MDGRRNLLCLPQTSQIIMNAEIPPAVDALRLNSFPAFHRIHAIQVHDVLRQILILRDEKNLVLHAMTRELGDKNIISMAEIICVLTVDSDDVIPLQSRQPLFQPFLCETPRFIVFRR